MAVELDIRIKKFLLFLGVLHPSFIFYSKLVSRSIELIVLLIFAVFVFLYKLNLNYKYTLWLGRIYLLIFFAILISSSFSPFTWSDLNEFYRPLWWVLFVIVCGSIEFQSLRKIVILLVVVNSILVIIEFLLWKNVEWLYALWSNKNLYLQRRPAGFLYTHTELSLLSNLGIFLLIEGRKKLEVKNVLLIVVFLVAGSLSQSKSGLLMMFAFLFGVLIFSKHIHLLIKLLAVFLIGIVMLNIVDYFPYLVNGFSDLLRMKTGNLSIGNRVDDWVNTINRIRAYPYSLFFGNGPMRSSPEISYIEITVVNILFRFGLVGVFLYYSFLFKMKSSHITFIFILSILLGDVTSNMTETLKVFPLVLAVLYSLKRYTDVSVTNIK